MKKITIIFVFMLDLQILSSSAYARPTHPEEERLIGTCIRKASFGHVWLEKTLWGLRDQEAGWVGAKIPNRNGSYDLGPLQINSWWVSRIAKSVRRSEGEVQRHLTFDACFNVEAARWIFLSALKNTGDYWKAIGTYHSPTIWRQRSYRHSVYSRLVARFGEGIFENASSPSVRACLSPPQ
ncbi:MAG: lytic transglycosylase domain-containing protein [Novosphingobium sp.]